MGKTGIEWTERTWNPVVGCTKIAAGCKNCYAKTLHDMRHDAHKAGKKVPLQYAEPFEKVQLMPERIKEPLKWQKGGMVFVNSMSDLFHKDVPDEYLFHLFAVMALAGKQTFQVLTKRVQRMCEFMNKLARSVEPLEKAARDLGYTLRYTDAESGRVHPLLPWPIPNVWLGASFAVQEDVDHNWRWLNDTPAVVRFASCEPLLESLDLTKPLHLDRCHHRQPKTGYQCGLPEGHAEGESADDSHTTLIPTGYPWFGHKPLQWAIVGGESGPQARWCFLDDVRGVVRQCRKAKTPVFVKQLGSRPAELRGPHMAPGSITLDTYDMPGGEPDDEVVPVAIGDRKGGDLRDWPSDLRIREFPQPRVK